MPVSIEKCKSLEVKNLFSKYAKCKRIDSNYFNEKILLGLYFSTGNSIEQSYYVYGTIKNFKSELGTCFDAKPLGKGYMYLESFAYGAPKNELMYKYMHEEIYGNVIVYKSDNSDIDKTIHKNLSIICGKLSKEIKKCDICFHLINEVEQKNFKVKTCYFMTCKKNENHSHYFCNFCYHHRLYSDKNEDSIKNNIKFLKP
jgi:hypothetical protein